MYIRVDGNHQTTKYVRQARSFSSNSNGPIERFMVNIIYEKASPFDNSNLIKYLNLSLVLFGLFFDLFLLLILINSMSNMSHFWSRDH